MNEFVAFIVVFFRETTEKATVVWCELFDYYYFNDYKSNVSIYGRFNDRFYSRVLYSRLYSIVVGIVVSTNNSRLYSRFCRHTTIRAFSRLYIVVAFVNAYN